MTSAATRTAGRPAMTRPALPARLSGAAAVAVLCLAVASTPVAASPSTPATASVTASASTTSGSMSSGATTPNATISPVDSGGSVVTTAEPVRLLEHTVVGPGASEELVVPAVPDGATAVLVNVTVTEATARSTITFCDPSSACPREASIVAVPGVPVSRLVTAPVADGRVVLRNSTGEVALRADLAAYVQPVTSAGGEQFVPVEHQRVLSRQVLRTRGATVVQLPAAPPGARAAVIDVGFSSATVASHISACHPAQTPARCMRTAVVHTAPRLTHSNLAVVPVDASGRVKLYNRAGSVRLNADLQGWFVPVGAEGASTVLVPASGSVSTRLAAAGATRTVTLPNVPADATAVAVIVTTTSAAASTGLWACPAGAVLDQCRSASVADPLPGRITENTAFVALGGPNGDQVTLGTTLAAADVTLSPFGYIVPAGDSAPAPGDSDPAPGDSDPVPPVKPGPDTTGVPDGTALQRHDGDIVVTEAGTVIENRDIRGFVVVQAADVVIRNSIVRGSGPGTANRGLVTCNHSACTNLLVEDVTLVPDYPSVWLNGVFGHDYTARRVDTFNVVDGFQIHNVRNNGGPVNVVIEDSWCHDMSFFAVDPNHGNTETHNDCIQIQGGSNITITGNNLESFMSTDAGDQTYDARNRGSALMVTPNAAPVSGAVVTGNWLDGGYASAFFTTSKFPTMHFGTFSGNWFGRNQFDHGRGSRYQIRVAQPEAITFDVPLTTNMWEDGSGPLAEGRDLGIRFGG